ncbi:energy-coupling factor ABC transporter ATP-binding protein [Paenibacillus koleovorans]|uniref:energy-coupling factor ABC transporter ATP-binding protein n=1 Tax=Paenibacillus koleovorans TaxID=121608 RepID=UPI000FDBCA51|nr:ATP-binding cassette domain-containing protein [Paenibacillus koleovorans]
MEPVFEFDRVSYRYSKERDPALNQIDFQIPLGRKTAIVGPNGAGKSTLIFHLNGLFICQAGQVRFRGEIINAINNAGMVRHVGVVFQDPDDQIISMTVRDDVAFGPTQSGLPPAEAFHKAEQSMELLRIGHLAGFNPHELSLGQKKLVAIAGAIAMNPEVIVIDEPMAFLDPAGQKRVREVMDQLSADGKTVIVATHSMQLVAEWADYVIIMKEGQCLGSMTPRELFCENAHLLEEAHLELPPVLQLLSGLWKEQYGEMPIKLEEARRALAKLLN